MKALQIHLDFVLGHKKSITKTYIIAAWQKMYADVHFRELVLTTYLDTCHLFVVAASLAG